jgi:hypothetical protein
VVTCYDARNGDLDIYAQRYSMDGNPTGNNMKVNDDVSGTGQYNPDIATNGNETFIITWYDYSDMDDWLVKTIDSALR